MKFDLEFHRGGRDARPENTLYSYQYAIENGASTIECDMQLTKDLEIVMSHNPALNPDITLDKFGNRIKNNNLYIHDMNLKEIQEYNVGIMDKTCEYYKIHGKTQVMVDAFIPTLRQLFDLVKNSKNEDIRISVEAKYYADKASSYYLKNPDKDIWLKEFVKIVKEFHFENRVILQCFDWSLLVRLKEIEPKIETIGLYVEQNWNDINSKTLWIDKKEPSPWLSGINIHDFNDDPIEALHYLKIDSASPYYKELTKEQVIKAHKYNMKVVPWTVNDKEDILKLYDMGVDGIITDKPWILKEVLEEKGYKMINHKTSLPYHLDIDHYE